MDTDIFEQFPDRETFDKYWNENYQPVTYEGCARGVHGFCEVRGRSHLPSDYEEKGLISREDFKENLSQEAQFTFEDGLTEVFTIRIRSFTRRRSVLYEESKLTGKGDASVAQTFHETFRALYAEFLDRLYDEVLEAWQR